jgi:hypothetical protein
MVRWLWSVYDEVTDYLQENGFYNQLLSKCHGAQIAEARGISLVPYI